MPRTIQRVSFAFAKRGGQSPRWWWARGGDAEAFVRFCKEWTFLCCLGLARALAGGFAVAFGNPHFPSLLVFGWVGAEQKEGWFYVTDNKQPKIKIKILGNGERGSPRSSPGRYPARPGSAKAKIEKAGGRFRRLRPRPEKKNGSVGLIGWHNFRVQ